MSGKLDQSLDQIMKDGPKPARGPRRIGKNRPTRRAATKAKAAIAAPAGGVQKNKKPTVQSAATTLTAASTGDSKIIVSNLPQDVTDTLIKDYFGKTIAPVKKVFITYGPDGRSRGVATIIFSDPAAGPKAAKQLDGVKVDNRPMRIEVIISAKHAPAPAAAKSLADRMAQPKSVAAKKEKEKAKDGLKANNTKTNGAAKGKDARGKKAGRAGRPKKKTAEELDAEMVDYFGTGDGAAAIGTAQPPAAAANGDTGMDDEVL